jgi:hypothetical protein
MARRTDGKEFGDSFNNSKKYDGEPFWHAQNRRNIIPEDKQSLAGKNLSEESRSALCRRMIFLFAKRMRRKKFAAPQPFRP